MSFHGDNSVFSIRLVTFQNNQRLLGYRPTSALHSCSPRCNRPPRANPNPERADDRHTAVDGTPLLSLRENAIAKEPGPDILSLGGVCFGSLLQWWPRLL